MNDTTTLVLRNDTRKERSITEILYVKESDLLKIHKMVNKHDNGSSTTTYIIPSDVIAYVVSSDIQSPVKGKMAITRHQFGKEIDFCNHEFTPDDQDKLHHIYLDFIQKVHIIKDGMTRV